MSVTNHGIALYWAMSRIMSALPDIFLGSNTLAASKKLHDGRLIAGVV